MRQVRVALRSSAQLSLRFGLAADQRTVAPHRTAAESQSQLVRT